jgi:TonB family protein
MLRTALALTFLFPLTLYAKDVDIPELGIKLTQLPDDAGAAQVRERPAGYEARLQLGTDTFLAIYRQDDPVAPGNLSDPDYRNSLLAGLDASKKSKSKGGIASVGGHDAWILTNAEQLGPLPLVTYSLSSYLVVDEHLYRIGINALGAKRPPEFDVAVKALSSVSFEPVQRTVVPEHLGPGGIPRFVIGSDESFYPAEAISRGEQGVVDLEFSIDGRGHVQNLRQVYAAHRDLSTSATAFLENGVYRVPPDWEQSGSTQRRFTAEFQFKLAPRGAGSGCSSIQDDPPRIPDAVVFAICRARVR